MIRALVAFAFVLLAACTRVGTAPEGGGNPWTHHGLLRIVNLSEPDTLNPVVGNQQIDSDLANLWGGQLLEWSDRNEWVPDLATAVPTYENGGITRDGKTIVYHLRRGVRWQDGAPFTADDVIFSWRAVMNKKNNVPSTVGYDAITRIDRRGPYDIAVHLREPYAPFIGTFFAPSADPYPVLPEHLLARYDNLNQIAFNSKPVGTGPFVVDRWQRGSKIVFRANPHYWRGAPKLHEIWYSPVSDENTVATLMQSHAADLEYRAAATYYDRLSKIDGYVATLTPFTGYGQLGINVRSPVVADVRVRRALWYALDTPAIIRDVTHGVDVVGFSDQPEFSWAYDPAVPHYAYDPARARALLDAAGWKPGPDGVRVRAGRRLTIALAGVAGSAVGNAVNVLAQRYWRDVGIETRVKLYVTSLFFASYGAGGIVQTGKFDAAFYAWFNGVDPDDSTLFMCDQIPPHGQNTSAYCNRDVDAAERVALARYDRPSRKRAYATIQRRLATDVPTIVLWYDRRVTIANRDLRGYRPAHAVTTFWNPYDWSI